MHNSYIHAIKDKLFTILLFVESSVDSEEHFPSSCVLHLTLVVTKILLSHTREAHSVGPIISCFDMTSGALFGPVEREPILSKL